MKDEIKEKIKAYYIGNDIDQVLECITNLQEKVDQYENPDDMTLMFMWCDEKAKDKIKQLQEEYEKEHYLVDKLTRQLNDEYKNTEYQCKQKEDYKLRNEKAINEVIRVLQIILEQPSEDKLDDLWIINKLEGIQTLLQGEDKDE